MYAFTLQVGGQVKFHDQKELSIPSEPKLATIRGQIGIYDPQGDTLRALAMMDLPQAGRGRSSRLASASRLNPLPPRGGGPGGGESDYEKVPNSFPTREGSNLRFSNRTKTTSAGDIVVVTDLNHIASKIKTLIIGTNALTEAEAGSSRLAAWASAGHRLIVLDQDHPLHYQGLPVPVESTNHSGSFAFPEDLTHPILKGLRPEDFYTWDADGKVYRNSYQKPEKGARSLIQCDKRLSDSALMQVPVGSGFILLTQLNLHNKLESNVTARTILKNLITYAQSYRVVSRVTNVFVPAQSQFSKALDQIGLSYERAKTPLEAMKAPGIAIIEADAATLRILSQNLETVRAFTKAGGSLVLHGLTPDGLTDYNQIVGVDHMIRPFRREKVTWPNRRHPLTTGMTLADVVLYSAERMFDFNEDRFVANDTFSYVVDYDDVAPFATLPDDYAYNIVNGMVSADGWKYIYSFDLNRTKPVMPIKLPKPQKITDVTWIGNAFYHLVTSIQLSADGKTSVEISTKPSNELQEFHLTKPIEGQNILLAISKWQSVPSAGANVVGIDNISLKAERSKDFYKRVHPLVNVGGLVLYDDGPGNILLANINFREQEEVPVNAYKKRTILATLLRNLNGKFAAGQTIVAGADLAYTPIDISKQANAYRSERGWFGDPNLTFRDLPIGKQKFAGVPFQVYEFPTSPVPTVVMLGGDGLPTKLPAEVTGIPVNALADSLFFLQTARLDQHRNADEVRTDKTYEMARYVVHYADGQTATIPIRAEIDVDDFRQTHPVALPGAQLGWTKRYESQETYATAYVQQWNNSRPEVRITSIDLTYGPDRRGIPVVLAVTSGTSAKGKP